MNSYEKWAKALTLLWGFSIFAFWFAASWSEFGQKLADVPAGLAAVILAVVGAKGWKNYATIKWSRPQAGRQD